MKFLFVIMLLGLVGIHGHGQPVWSWARQADTGHPSWIASIASDDSGNVYAAGTFKGNTFGFQDFQLANANLSQPDLYADGFIVRMDSSGTAAWLLEVSGAGADYPTFLVSDVHSRLYIAGHSESERLYLGQDSIVFGHWMDCFLAAMDLEGNIQWCFQWGGEMNDWVNDIALDPDGNIVVSATIVSDTTWLGPMPVFKPIQGSFDTDVLVFKVSSQGVPQWNQVVASNANDFGDAMAVGPDGNILMGVSFTGDNIVIDGLSKSFI
jgi:hypothetical protein